ncbi:MAG: S8 family serine peptidase [Verrucomicrobiales bacterium]|nr:S8 family serine peptidase [Verrucomicrobiales bacterium]
MFQGIQRVVFCLWFLTAAAAQDTRFIRLRNETIATPAKPAPVGTAQSRAAEAAVSGLYLVQFQTVPDLTAREALRTRGVELVQYVPDNAFVTRVTGVTLSSIRADPAVRWVGPYEARHKMDPRLNTAFQGRVGAKIPIRLLTRPDLAGEDLALVFRHLQGARRRVTLGTGSTFEGSLNLAQLRVLARSPGVLWIEPAPRMKMVDAVATEVVMGEFNPSGERAQIQTLGFDGRGVIVSVADSGIDTGEIDFMHPDLEGRVEALLAYDNLPDAADEHSHGTHCAGIVLGNGATGERDDSGYLYGLGVAPGARLVGQRIFDGAGDFRPPATFTRMVQDAVRHGAYVGSNSWGDDNGGQYDLSAWEFDALVRDADPDFPGEQGYILEFSAGNSGPGAQTIGTPAVAKNVLATGATQNNRFEFPLYGEGQEVMADFSSRGPAADGRIKPDLVAPGTWIASLRSLYANDNNAWGPISDRYLYQGGTSQAGPHAAGGAAVAVQWYRDNHGGATPSPALVKAMLINSADDMSTAVIPDTGGDPGEDPVDPGDGIVVGDTGPVPNNDEGWGRMNLVNLIDSERRYEFLDQGAGLASGQVFERRAVVGAGEPLKVTLVYTDVPGNPAAIPALVNDLDLEVIAPNGDLYRGNAFNEGESVAGTVLGDCINNVEAVHLSSPAAGEWILRVRGTSVVQDVHRRTGIAAEQDFALVVSGQLPAPGEGVISWDRVAYRAPATATLRLVDQQLSAQASVTVTVSGTTEPAGQTVVLNRVGNGGNFLGTIGLSAGAPVAGDGQLSVVDGEEITAVYVDTLPAGERRATAVIDAQPPVISGVTATQQFGTVRIQWLNSEPASSRVWFGPTNAVTTLVSDPAFRLQPGLTLSGLEPGTTYFFYVAATDRAGNSATNDNGGVYLRFTAPRAASALLVYSPETSFEQLSDTTYPGMEYWTSALDALRVDYEVWDTSVENRAPRADELQPYRLVVWRPEESAGPLPGMTAAVSSYVGRGGSLFVVSHDLLTRLKEIPGETNFMRDILHVKDFQADQGATVLSAVPGDLAGAGLETALSFDAFPSGFLVDLLFQFNGLSGWEDVTDHITPAADAAPVFLQEGQRVVGLRYPRTGEDTAGGRVVFYAFPFEAVPLDTPAPNNRPTLLANALRFLTPELSPGGAIAFDQGAYTVPANVLVEVIDSGRAGAGTVAATVSNGGEHRTLMLAESARRGVFRGRISLQAPGGPAGTDRLPAVHGDVLVTTYVDSANAESLSRAEVDTRKPVISGVTPDPAYNEAYVSWTTDKPTDALVRFGESGGDESFLTRSGYNAELGTSHEVRLTGLLPDRTYFFQVVCRDAAGNLAADGSNGAFHTLRTLKPLSAPWADSFDAAQDGWVVYNDTTGTGVSFPDDGEDDGGDGFSFNGWQFGVPSNVDAVGAHTGSQVWATNLKGQDVDYSSSDLISPAIGLIGGNRATLRFWQYYDFSQSGGSEDDPFGDFVLEAAQIAVTRDDGATWQDVYAVGDEFSAGWEEVEVDLSKFLGSVIRVRFNYQLFAFTPGPRMGWLLDDVGIELNIVPDTRVTVTNNLAQASFVLTGPVTASGSGLQFQTNLPPGTYGITWQPVPFHETPPSQSGTLGSSGPLAFTGRYTFPDVNGNGISDLWETAYFGSAAPGFTGDGDADADGASDRAEWTAGTSPRDPAEVLRLGTPESLPNGTLQFRWPTTPGRLYTLEVANRVDVWAPVGAPGRGTGDPMTLTLPALDPRLPYFFRVVVTP